MSPLAHESLGARLCEHHSSVPACPVPGMAGSLEACRDEHRTEEIETRWPRQQFLISELFLQAKYNKIYSFFKKWNQMTFFKFYENLTMHLGIIRELHAWVRACSVAQSCLTLCDPMDCSSPGFSVLGILQARILDWDYISFSRGSSWPSDRILIYCTGRQILL